MKKILTKIKIIFTLIHTYIRLFYKKGGSSLILEPSLFLRKEVTGTI